MTDPDLVQQMKERAEAVQAVVTAVSGLEEAIGYVVDLTRRQEGGSVAAAGWPDDRPVRLLADACRSADLRLIAPPLREHAQQIHTAFTPAPWAVADTGTLVIPSNDESLRMATMLAETHVALLPAAGIRPDTAALHDELDAILKGDGPSYTAFITGASRTADIERVLAIGVHGPQQLHILISEEASP